MANIANPNVAKGCICGMSLEKDEDCCVACHEDPAKQCFYLYDAEEKLVGWVCCNKYHEITNLLTARLKGGSVKHDGGTDMTFEP